LKKAKNKLSEKMQLVSKSPRRREILSELYENIEAVNFSVKEFVPAGMPVAKVAAFLAELKMDSFLKSEITKKEIVITADTIVCYPEDNVLLGKPSSKQEAREMLEKHFGREHSVITAVCYFDLKQNKREVVVDEAKVTFKAKELVPEEAITKYIDLVPPFGPMDKAGAYGIQEQLVTDYMIESFIGDKNTVVGFPLQKFISVIVNSSSGNI